MIAGLEAPPVLSTPDTHILNESIPATIATFGTDLSDEQLFTKYEIQKTLDEIRSRQWRRIALQFPDGLLHDAPRVYQQLSRRLGVVEKGPVPEKESQDSPLQDGMSNLAVGEQAQEPKLFILGDTSYGSCCIDEIAAEHADADAVVHYGRACLSPTARLPVFHVFTRSDLDLEQVISSFVQTFPGKDAKVLLTADVSYANHIPTLHSKLKERGYINLFAAELIHDPSSPVPNRTVPEEVQKSSEMLAAWSVCHLAQPPTSLLLTLSSRVEAFHVFPAESTSTSASFTVSRTTAAMLRRRYALVTSLATVGIWGILINTLSVKNYMHIVDHVKDSIAAAGKKSYMFVVGKLNAAKVANFSEIGGWVVIGCWESSLIDSQDFYKPVITPFELNLALSRDSDRIWTGEWRSDFQTILDDRDSSKAEAATAADDQEASEKDGDSDSEMESAPPEFDLRTGKYVSHSRPMLSRPSRSNNQASPISSALTKKAKGDMISINGTASPGAEFLREKRTWQGLGSDFEIQYEDGAALQVQEGRSGIARGYTVGNDTDRR